MSPRMLFVISKYCLSAEATHNSGVSRKNGSLSNGLHFPGFDVLIKSVIQISFPEFAVCIFSILIEASV